MGWHSRNSIFVIKKVGDVIVIANNDIVPCDVLILSVKHHGKNS